MLNKKALFVLAISTVLSLAIVGIISLAFPAADNMLLPIVLSVSFASVSVFLEFRFRSIASRAANIICSYLAQNPTPDDARSVKKIK